MVDIKETKSVLNAIQELIIHMNSFTLNSGFVPLVSAQQITQRVREIHVLDTLDLQILKGKSRFQTKARIYGALSSDDLADLATSLTIYITNIEGENK